MPRVGSSSSRTDGDAKRQRARIAFCWLPPESVPIGVDGDAARTPVSRMPRSAASRAAAPSIQPNRLTFSSAPSVMFRPTGRSGKIACALRSSGSSTRP